MFLEIERPRALKYYKYSNLSSIITQYQVEIELEFLDSIMNQDIWFAYVVLLEGFWLHITTMK